MSSPKQLSAELAEHWSTLARTFGSRKLSASLHPVLARKLSPASLQALHLLAHGEPPRISALARELGLDESTVTRLVDKLESLGLAERHDAAGDRRSTVVWLTAEGRKAVASMHEQRRVFLAEVLSALEPEEREEFVRLTAKAAEVLQARAAEVVRR
jgi:DNA-binding MarR family transcriptional regulator